MLHRFLSLSSSLSPHLLSSPSPRRLQQMEFVQGGFGPDTAAKTDDCGGGDDFFVDELLDFSNGFSDTEEEPPPQAEEPPENEQGQRKTSPVSPENQAPPPPEDEFESLHESKLTVQAEEGLESLEWLSHFVEDSFSDYSLAGKPQPKAAEELSKPLAAVKEKPCFNTPVQTKARTKRARTGVRVWPVLSPSRTEPSAASSSSSTSSTTSFSSHHLWLVQSQAGVNSPPGAAAPKRKKRKTVDEGGGGGAAQPRRCSHCGVTKTPQWRAGPEGSKTLCNACGVRFKSGRLLPEYRPACSPTFSSELHSNNHRKVLEMRRKKEDEAGDTGLPPPVQSF